MPRSSPTVSEKLAELILNLKYENLPEDVIHSTKRLFLDTLACAIGGRNGEPVQMVLKTVDYLGGNPQATIIGSRKKTSGPLATLVNGAMIRYLDFNDYQFSRDSSHPSSNLAMVLALAEAEGLSGKDVILGAVIAYEIQLRFATYCGEPNLSRRGWRSPATHASFASTAAACRMLNLDNHATMSAFGINGSHNSTLAQSHRGTMSMMKATAEATASKAGLEATLLARSGMTGPPEIFEGESGWIKIIAGGADIDGMTEPFQGRFRITDMCMKPYATNMSIQASIQAALDLMAEHNFKLSQVDKIEVFYSGHFFKKPSADKATLLPETRETADHSPLYCVAIALLEKACGPEQFTDEKLFDPNVRNLMQRIELKPDDELTALQSKTQGSKVRIMLDTGETHQKDCLYPPGNPKNPLSDGQIADKFRTLSRGVLTDSQTEKAIEAVWAIDTCSDIGALMKTLSG
ncbi:MAG: MmgE/PrpD family protein [Rhodospirillaceae bacterium]|jgi:2-methylcitrate dehydratase